MTQATSRVFDYRVLRLTVAIVAFALPPVVSIVATTELSSVSASYHTEARDLFVGMLVAVGALMYAYRGYSAKEACASIAGATAAVVVALFPTHRDGFPETWVGDVHLVAALLLFGILAYFALGPFRSRPAEDPAEHERRKIAYLIAGSGMVIAILAGIAALWFLPEAWVKENAIIYHIEFLALYSFGLAWLVASKVVPGLAGKNVRLVPGAGNKWD